MVNEGQDIIVVGTQHHNGFILEDGTIGTVVEVYWDYFITEFDIGEWDKRRVSFEFDEEGMVWRE